MEVPSLKIVTPLHVTGNVPFMGRSSAVLLRSKTMQLTVPRKEQVLNHHNTVPFQVHWDTVVPTAPVTWEPSGTFHDDPTTMRYMTSIC